MAQPPTRNLSQSAVSSNLELGAGGPRLKDNGGVIEARNAADAALAVMRAAPAVGADDVVVKSQLPTSSGGPSGQNHTTGDATTNSGVYSVLLVAGGGSAEMSVTLTGPLGSFFLVWARATFRMDAPNTKAFFRLTSDGVAIAGTNAAGLSEVVSDPESVPMMARVAATGAAQVFRVEWKTSGGGERAWIESGSVPEQFGATIVVANIAS